MVKTILIPAKCHGQQEIKAEELAKIVWQVAEPADQLEYVHVTMTAGRANVVTFHGNPSATSAIMAAERIGRTMCAEVPPLTDWVLWVG